MSLLTRLFRHSKAAAAPARPASAAETSLVCSGCRRSFAWNDSWRESHDPLKGDLYWNKVYCPHCGCTVACDLGNGWSWYGGNAAFNEGRALPPSALLLWGRVLPRHQRVGFDAERVDLRRGEPSEEQLAKALAAQSSPDFGSFREAASHYPAKREALCWLIAAEEFKHSGRQLLSLQCYVEFLLRFPAQERVDNVAWMWIADAFFPKPHRAFWIVVTPRVEEDLARVRALQSAPRPPSDNPKEVDALLQFLQQLIGKPGEEADPLRVELAHAQQVTA